MNETKSNSLSVKESKELSHKDIAVSTENTSNLEDVQTSTAWSTYETFYWFYNYTRMFTHRVIKDLLITLIGYVYSGQMIPKHIADLISVQKRFITEREAQSVIHRREDDDYVQFSMKNMYNTIKTIISSEDDIAIQCTSRDFVMRDREPMFVIVHSSCDSDPSSEEILLDGKIITPPNKVQKKIQTIDMPSTSTDTTDTYLSEELECIDELIMMDINLQSDNDITVDNDIDNDSIVMSYLRNKTIPLKFEEYSETSLDVHIPSFPGSPRSLESISSKTMELNDYRTPELERALNFLHAESEFLEAARDGDVQKLEELIGKGANIHETDHINRNALHLGVCSGNRKAVILLLKAGINPNERDNVGHTPLSLCLWRCPSVSLVKLLFLHGAVITPRFSVANTGLFLQYILMCTPTEKEEQIIYLLVENGALVNDPDAPGGRQALHLAAMSNNCALIKILYALGANLYSTNFNDQTAKEFALIFKCKEAYDLLEELEVLFAESVSLVSRMSMHETGGRRATLTSIKSVGTSEN